MFPIYTKAVENILKYADDEAQMLNFDHIGTEHIVLGILRVPGSHAADVLKRMGVHDIDSFRQICKELPCYPKSDA